MKLRYRTTYRARTGHLVVIPDGAKIRPISNYGTLDGRAIDVRLSPDDPLSATHPGLRWSVLVSDLSPLDGGDS